MTRRRGNAMDLRPPLSTCRKPEMRLLLTAVILLVIGECQGDSMMGGHLDNKETNGGYVMEHRSDEDPSQVSSRTSPRLEVDGDFDLELDLLAEQSAPDSSKSNGANASATISGESDTAPRYRVLPYAFNGGQPFSLEKDPITGQIDFEKAPPLKALEYNVKSSVENAEDEAGTSAEDRLDENGQREDVALGPNEINPYSPSFHDFLNLPVRYSYDKYENAEKYPLISSSYANTKVQSGSNSYNTYNHKKYHETVKAGVDVQTLYVQPSRKTYHDSVTRTTARPTSTTSSTERTPPPTSTTAKTTTPSSTTSRPSNTSRSPSPTTWKPKQSPNRPPNIYGIYGDYEATLPIERLQQASNSDKETTTEGSTPPTPDSSPDSDSEADYDGYDEDYDRILQIADRPSSHEESASQDYSMDIAEDSRPPKETAPPSSTTSLPASSAITSPRPSTTVATTRFTTTNSEDDDRTVPTTSRPLEEKRVTSMPIDDIGYSEDYRVTGHYGGNGAVLATSDNTIPSVANALYQNNRPGSSSNAENYYGRPGPIGIPIGAPIGMPAGGIVVKSTSNVVVPPGQDTVSFVLGNHQSVGSVSDADFYGIRAPSSLSNSRPNVSFGKIGPSRPGAAQDNYSGQMIVSAGIGVGSAPIGSYHQRQPISGGDSFDHAVVTVGMPAVHVASPGESGGATSNNKNPDATGSLDTRAGQTWWASTGSSASSQQSESQDSTSQKFGYRVVFPDDKTPGGSENAAGTARPIEEHVIVVHESELGNGNSIRLDLSSSPTTGYHPDSPTTQRLPVSTDDKPLPELSESLTPPAERPNVLPSGIQRPPPTYNYYHHHHHNHHSPGNSRPSDYRDQRLPPRVPLPQSALPASGSNAFKRRPATPPVDSNLPNILPQFRPNAKTSHGHNRGETIGTISAGAPPPHTVTRIRRPPPHHQQHHHHHRSPPSRRPSGPPHLQRLNPPPLPPPPPPISALRLPTPVPLVASSSLGLPTNQHETQNENSVRLGGPQNGSLHKVSVGVPPSLSLDERHRQTIKSRLEDDNLERFSAEPPIRPPYFTKRTSSDNDGVPRIATLQMIQHVGSRDEDTLRPSLPPYRFDTNEKKPSNGEDVHEDDQERDEATGEGDSADRRGDDEATRADYVDNPDSPVYIVYPAKGVPLDTRSEVEAERDDASVILGTYGSQRPLPPDTLLQDTDESVKDPYDGSTSVAESPRPQLASDFPYPLERPDPSMFTSQLRETPLLVPSEQRKTSDRTQPDDNVDTTSNGQSGIDVVRDIDRDASVNVIPYLQDHVPFALKENAGAISATLHRLSSSANVASSTPIAYVYTPTTGRPVRRQDDLYANLERAGPVLLPSQQPSSSSSSAPSPQSFMAPFVASASAEAPSKNGWSVVLPGAEDSTNRRRHDNPPKHDTEAKQSGPPVENDNKDSPNESMSDASKSSETTGNYETIDSQTEKNEFDVENFTPQLFGGFRPIFEFPSDDDTDPGMADTKNAESGSVVERPRSETG